MLCLALALFTTPLAIHTPSKNVLTEAIRQQSHFQASFSISVWFLENFKFPARSKSGWDRESRCTGLLSQSFLQKSWVSQRCKGNLRGGDSWGNKDVYWDWVCYWEPIKASWEIIFIYIVQSPKKCLIIIYEHSSELSQICLYPLQKFSALFHNEHWLNLEIVSLVA